MEHLFKMANDILSKWNNFFVKCDIKLRWPMIFSQNAMVFSQVEHLIKMVNDFYSNATWFATHNVFISYLLTHLFTQPTTYIPITHPPTYLLFT